MSKDKKPAYKATAAKPAAAALTPAAITPVPVTAPVAAAIIEAPKVEVPKPAPASIAQQMDVPKAEASKTEPVKTEAAKPAIAKAAAQKAAPVAAAAKTDAPKVETVKAERAKAEMPKAVPAKSETPKAAPAKKAAKVEFDTMKPFALFQEQIRLQAEKGAEQARSNYAVLKGNAETATAKLEESMIAARTGAKLIGEKMLDAVRMQTQANLDLAQKFGAVKSLDEAVKLQQAFMAAQLDAFKVRATEFVSVSGKIANDIAEPAKASLTAAFRR